MRRWSAIVALLVLSPSILAAQASSWQVDIAGAALVEAWEFNESKESLAGLVLGAEGRLWKGLRVRFEGVLLHVNQVGTDGWLRGLTIGTRTRWDAPRIKPFVDVAVGASEATVDIPARGTRMNFLALAGLGIHVPIQKRLTLDIGGRWFHVSNNGREGRHRNPDIQSLGAVIAIGWVYD